MTDPIDRLVEDHRKLVNLLHKLSLDDDDGAAAQLSPDEVLRELEEEFESHSRLEEALFHPALGVSDAASQRAIFEHRREHEEVAAAVDGLKNAPARSEEFSRCARELEAYITEHAELEEAYIFPQLRELLTAEQRERLGAMVPPRRDDS